MTLATENGTPYLWLERNTVVLAAVVADNLEFLWRIVALSSFLCAALRTPLRSSHVLLVKRFLLFLSEKKNFLTLNARCFYVRHRVISLGYSTKKGRCILAQMNSLVEGYEPAS